MHLFPEVFIKGGFCTTSTDCLLFWSTPISFLGFGTSTGTALLTISYAQVRPLPTWPGSRMARARWERASGRGLKSGGLMDGVP